MKDAKRLYFKLLLLTRIKIFILVVFSGTVLFQLLTDKIPHYAELLVFILLAIVTINEMIIITHMQINNWIVEQSTSLMDRDIKIMERILNNQEKLKSQKE